MENIINTPLVGLTQRQTIPAEACVCWELEYSLQAFVSRLSLECPAPCPPNTTSVSRNSVGLERHIVAGIRPTNRFQRLWLCGCGAYWEASGDCHNLVDERSRNSYLRSIAESGPTLVGR